jgi:hypothetical protein
VDILGHVGIQLGKSLDIGGIAAPPWNFFVLDTSQFVVLLPQIGFEDFGGRQEPQNGLISLGETATLCLCEDR